MGFNNEVKMLNVKKNIRYNLGKTHLITVPFILFYKMGND